LDFTLLQKNIIINIVLAYFIGIVISSIGNLTTDKILKKLIPQKTYSEYLTSSKKDTKIEEFSEINNMYRTIITLHCCIFIIFSIENLTKIFPLLSKIPITLIKYIILIIPILLFIFSYKKQNEYIQKRISETID
jgi:H+/gluconate symporter-like permease